MYLVSSNDKETKKQKHAHTHANAFAIKKQVSHSVHEQALVAPHPAPAPRMKPALNRSSSLLLCAGRSTRACISRVSANPPKAGQGVPPSTPPSTRSLPPIHPPLIHPAPSLRSRFLRTVPRRTQVPGGPARGLLRRSPASRGRVKALPWPALLSPSQGPLPPCFRAFLGEELAVASWQGLNVRRDALSTFEKSAG